MLQNNKQPCVMNMLLAQFMQWQAQVSSIIVLHVFFQLRAKARGSHCGVFMSDMKLRIDQGVCFYYPDVMLTCNANDTETYFKENSCLI